MLRAYRVEPTISTILDREYVVKEGKNLRPTPLGEVVTGLMKDKFTDIVDTAFTATMAVMTLWMSPLPT